MRGSIKEPFNALHVRYYATENQSSKLVVFRPPRHDPDGPGRGTATTVRRHPHADRTTAGAACTRVISAGRKAVAVMEEVRLDRGETHERCCKTQQAIRNSLFTRAARILRIRPFCVLGVYKNTQTRPTTFGTPTTIGSDLGRFSALVMPLPLSHYAPEQ
jgi:hypothetical protein